MLFTITMEYAGTSSASQYVASDPVTAFEDWIAGLDQRYAYGLTPDQANDVANAIQERLRSNHFLMNSSKINQDDIVSLPGMKNVWRFVTSIRRSGREPEDILLHIVGTLQR
jgi:hypothetical protein